MNNDPRLGRALFIHCSATRKGGDEAAYQIATQEWDNWMEGFMSKDQWQLAAERFAADLQPQTDVVADIHHMTYTRTISGPGNSKRPDNAIEVGLSLFISIMDADNTAGRRKYNDAYEYRGRNGVMGWLVYGRPASANKPLVPARYLIDPAYAEKIKLEITEFGSLFQEQPDKT